MPRPALRPDLIHRPGVGTSLREGWCHDPPESPSILSPSLKSHSFVRPRRPFLRPDLRSAERRAQTPSRIASCALGEGGPPARAARGVLDGGEHGATLAGS